MNGTTVKEIVAKFPWLKKSPDFFLKEYQRVTEVDLESEVKDFLDKYGNAILQVVRSKKKTNDFLMTSLADNTGNEKYAAACLTILGVPILFSEDRDAFLGVNKLVQDHTFNIH